MSFGVWWDEDTCANVPVQMILDRERNLGVYTQAWRFLGSRWKHILFIHHFQLPTSFKPHIHMGVSKNRGGPPKSSILIGFGTIIFTIHFGGFTTPIFGNIHIDSLPWFSSTDFITLDLRFMNVCFLAHVVACAWHWLTTFPSMSDVGGALIASGDVGDVKMSRSFFLFSFRMGNTRANPSLEHLDFHRWVVLEGAVQWHVSRLLFFSLGC